MTLTATQERDAGMAQALDHAEDVHPGWGDHALNLLGAWSDFHDKGFCFTSYDFLKEYEDNGHPMPPTPKAFGPVFTKAAREGLIRKVGYRPHPLRHASPTVLWEVV